MGFLETAFFYGLVGLAIAVAIVLRETSARRSTRLAFGLLGLFFWPFFAPSLLGGVGRGRRAAAREDTAWAASPTDAALERVLRCLDGAASELVRREAERIRHVAQPLRAMARRLDEMDALCRAPEFNRQDVQQRLERLAVEAPADDPRIETLLARLRNIERLECLRRDTALALDRSLLELEEVGAQVRLLELAGRSDQEVLDRLREVTAGIEGLTEGLWEAS